MELAGKFLPSYTVEDYKCWKGDWELIEGVPYAMTPSPSAKHQRTSFLIAKQIQIEEQLEDCPERCFVYQDLDWIVDERTVVRPDLVVVCKKVEEYIRSNPEVVFEVVSKSTAFEDEKVKFYLYEREKVKYYALVYPDIKKNEGF